MFAEGIGGQQPVIAGVPPGGVAGILRVFEEGDADHAAVGVEAPVVEGADDGLAVDAAKLLTDFHDFDMLWPSAGPDAIVYELGGQLWRYDTGDTVRSSPALGPGPGGKGAILYVGSANGTVYAATAAQKTAEPPTFFRKKATRKTPSSAG